MAIGISNFTAILRKANLIGFGVLNTGSDLTWILGISGGGTNPPTYVDLTSQIDNVRTVFALGGIPSSANNIEVVLNGLLQKPTTDYSVSGASLTMLAAPQVGDLFYARYWT